MSGYYTSLELHDLKHVSKHAAFIEEIDDSEIKEWSDFSRRYPKIRVNFQSDDETAFTYKAEDGRYNKNPYYRDFLSSCYLTDDMLDEWAKCRDSLLYFAQNYCVINHIDYGRHKIKLRPYQHRLLEILESNRMVVALQGRQSGKSTVYSIYLAWFTLFHRDKDCAIVAHKESGSINILERVKDIFENLPDFLQGGFKTLNEKQVELDNGSRITAFASTANGVRGGSFACFVVDEFAFIPKNKELFEKAIQPTISSGTQSRLLIASTANGFDYFKEIYDKAVKGVTAYKPFCVKWDEIPERHFFNDACEGSKPKWVYDAGESWKARTIAQSSRLTFAQEHDCSFLGSSATLINPKALDKIETVQELKQMFFSVGSTKLPIKIYEEPDENCTYVMGIDPSEMRGQDYTCIVVVNRTRSKVAAVFRENDVLPSHEIPRLIQCLSNFYNAWIVPERTSITGFAMDIIHKLSELNCSDRLYYDKTAKRYGIATTQETKTRGCVYLKNAIEYQDLKVEDSEILEELLRFVDTGNGSFRGQDYHDDLIMALIIAYIAMNDNNFTDGLNETYTSDLSEVHDVIASIIRG